MEDNSEQIGMKLYDVPRGSKIRVLANTKTAPFSKKVKVDDILTLEKLDGMYSICKDTEGNIIYLGATTQVEILK
jgi:hypothetical protein